MTSPFKLKVILINFLFITLTYGERPDTTPTNTKVAINTGSSNKNVSVEGAKIAIPPNNNVHNGRENVPDQDSNLEERMKNKSGTTDVPLTTKKTLPPIEIVQSHSKGTVVARKGVTLSDDIPTPPVVTIEEKNSNIKSNNNTASGLSSKPVKKGIDSTKPSDVNTNNTVVSSNSSNNSAGSTTNNTFVGTNTSSTNSSIGKNTSIGINPAVETKPVSNTKSVIGSNSATVNSTFAVNSTTVVNSNVPVNANSEGSNTHNSLNSKPSVNATNSTNNIKTNGTAATTPAATSTTKKPKKPTVTISSEDDPDEKLSSKTKTFSNDSPVSTHQTNTNYVVPIVAVILSVPLVAIVASVLYKRGSEWWQHRHYRRMDFLIDGMYNN